MAGTKFTLDRSSPVPLYFQVAEHFEQAILSGEIAPGDPERRGVLHAE